MEKDFGTHGVTFHVVNNGVVLRGDDPSKMNNPDNAYVYTDYSELEADVQFILTQVWEKISKRSLE